MRIKMDKIRTILTGIEGMKERISDKNEQYYKGQAEGLEYVKNIIYQQFPELQESEDERIMKAISAAICGTTAEKVLEANGVKLVDALAYLEKQKDPHYTKRNALFDKCVENCDPEVMKTVSDEVYEMLEKEQVQPEVELEEFDKDVAKLWSRCAAEPNDSIACLHVETFSEVARHFFELGLNARKED